MPRTKKKKSRQYFTESTERAIIRYNNSDNEILRNKIYQEHIEYPFQKLAENIIHTFKFYYFDVPSEDVKHEVVSFLVMNMHKFKAGKGKAFSYFTIIAKNYLILNNNGNYKRWQKNQLISEMPVTWNPENDFYKTEQNEEFSEFRKIMLSYWDKNLTVVFTKKRDIQIADAVLELFRRADYIENFNKKHLYLLIREMTDCKTHYITKVVNVMKQHQKKMLNAFLEGDVVEENINEFWDDEYHQ